MRLLAHRTDPASSHIAARDAEEAAAAQMNVVMRLVALNPGLTGAELAELTSLDKYQVRRRLSDLHRAGRVYQEGMRRCSVANRQSVLWFPEYQQAALL